MRPGWMCRLSCRCRLPRLRLMPSARRWLSPWHLPHFLCCIFSVLRIRFRVSIGLILCGFRFAQILCPELIMIAVPSSFAPLTPGIDLVAFSPLEKLIAPPPLPVFPNELPLPPIYACMMITEAKSTFSFLFHSVVQYIQILWDFLFLPVALTTLWECIAATFI